MPRPKDFNEDEVLDLAIDLFWQKGFYNTSMQDLVDHLGINRSSIYDSFSNKEGIFKKSIAAYCCANRETASEFLAQNESVKDGLKALLTNSILCTIKDPQKKGCFIVNTTTELAPSNRSLTRELSKNKESFEMIFIQLIEKGQAAGEIPKNKDASTLGSLIYTLFSGLNVITKLENNPDKLLAQIDTILTLLD